MMNNPLPRLNAQNRFQPVVFKSLSNPHSLTFRRWAQLYAQRFPFYERAPLPALIEGLEQRKVALEGYLFRSPIDGHWDWASFVCYEPYPLGTLLAYLATHPDYEGQGLARQLVRQLVEKSLGPQTPYFWLEAEPKLWSFYRRQGFFALPFTYLIPRFFDEGTVEMALFIKSAVSEVSRETVRQMVTTLYLQSYEISPEDPRFQQGLAEIEGLPEQIVIPPWAQEQIR
ncbi:GNAT family N-acetyltransferase [Galenea microaerophila]